MNGKTVLITSGIVLFLILSSFSTSTSLPCGSYKPNVQNLMVNLKGSRTENVYIIKASSEHEIKLINYSYQIDYYSNKNFSYYNTGYIGGCIITNGEEFRYFYRYTGSEQIFPGKLLYQRLRLFGGIIDSTIENRKKYNATFGDYLVGFGGGGFKFTIPNGTWYFVFYGGDFDVPSDYYTTEWDISLNFSNEYGDLIIDTYSGGKSYLVSYSGFDANFVKHEQFTDEKMLFGKLDLNIEHTFIFDFINGVNYPHKNGFWTIKWSTPTGIKRIFMTIDEEGFHNNPNKVNGTVYGIEGPGKYRCTTSYHDTDKNESASGLYFVGLDVELK